MKLYFIFPILFIFTTLNGQIHFETIVPWSIDTCVGSFSFYEKETGEISIFSPVYQFYDGSGILIEGPYIYGLGLANLTKEGVVSHKKVFSSNTNCHGNINPKNHYIVSKEKIYFPYTFKESYFPCDTVQNSIAIWSKNAPKAISVIDASNFNLINDECLDDNIEECKVNEIKLIDKVNGAFFVISKEKYEPEYTITKLNENLEIVETIKFEVLRSTGVFSDPFLETEFILTQPKEIQIYDFNGNINSTIPFLPPSHFEIHGTKNMVSTNLDNIAILTTSKLSYSEKKVTLTIVSRAGVTISQREFFENFPIDIKLLENNQLLVLGDNRIHYEHNDSISSPVIVSLLDLNLNTLKEKKYGELYVYPKKIQLLNNNSFGVLGTKVKSINQITGKEADKIYFLKASIHDLKSVSNLHKDEHAFFEIRPNPAIDYVDVLFHDKYRISNLELDIMDISGRVLKSIKRLNQEEVIRINIQSYAKGTYLITLKEKGIYLKTEKFIIL